MSKIVKQLLELAGTAVGMNVVLSAISWAIGGAMILIVLITLFFMGKFG